MFTRLSFGPVVVAAALLGCSVSAFAQSQPGPAGYDVPAASRNANGPAGPQAGRYPSRMRMAIRSLGLSPDQRMQIKAMMRGFHQSRLAGSPVPRRQMIAQIERVLTPAQRRQFEARIARRGQASGPNGPGGFRGPQGQGADGQGDPQGPGPGGDEQSPGGGAPGV